MLLRIYADANDQTADGLFELSVAGSLQDIQRHGSKLKPGMRVLLNVQDEFEVEGTLSFSGGVWYGRPDYATRRDL